MGAADQIVASRFSSIDLSNKATVGKKNMLVQTLLVPHYMKNDWCLLSLNSTTFVIITLLVVLHALYTATLGN